MVNTAVTEEAGSVICIERDPKLTYDISHRARLIDTVNYEIKGFEGFAGFISGLYAQNYDITSIFVDSLYKITGSNDTEKAGEFFEWLDRFSEQTKIKFVIMISADIDDIPKQARRYL